MISIANIIPTDTLVTIADIGASLVGGEQPIYQGLIGAGKARLLAFEPDASALEELRARYPDPHVCLPFFVGDGKLATFFETNWGPTGSLFQPNTPLLEKFHNLAEITRVVKTTAVDTVRLDDISEVDDVDFLKIDAQGAELMVFENARRVLEDVSLIHTEVCFVELYKGMPLLADVDRFLRSMGFAWHTRLGCGYRPFLPLKNADEPDFAFNQELWADVVYVRNWMDFDRLSPAKLLKLAVLLHDLYKSYDLAHLAMSSLDRQTGSNFAENYEAWLIE